MKQGSIGIWKVSPIFKGVGYATAVMSFWLNSYYIVILAWAIYYMAMSFSTVLPWSTCGNEWNTQNCIQDGVIAQNISNLKYSVSSAEEFWLLKTLKMSKGMDEVGSISWELAICLAIAWFLCYFCIWKGIKWSGKVVYFTSMFPYVLLFILLARGLTLDGALDGIKYLVIPNWSRLTNSEVISLTICSAIQANVAENFPSSNSNIFRI
jgi:solute carrier family 6 GABA transporter-like protein 1